MNILPKYSKWEILEVYCFQGVYYCVQAKMNLKTGYKKFKVSSVSRVTHNCHTLITKELINQTLTPNQ